MARAGTYPDVCVFPEMEEISGRNNENIHKIEEFTKNNHQMFRDLGFFDFLKEKDCLSVNLDTGRIKGSEELIRESVKEFEDSFVMDNVLIKGHPGIQDLFFDQHGKKNETILAYMKNVLSKKKILHYHFGYLKDGAKFDELEGVIFCRSNDVAVKVARSEIEGGFWSFPLKDCSKDAKEVIEQWKRKRKLVQTIDRNRVTILTGTVDVMMKINDEFNKKLIKTCPVAQHYAAFLSNQESLLQSFSQRLHVNIQINADKSELELTGTYMDIKQALSEIKAKIIVETINLPISPTGEPFAELNKIAEKHKCGWLVKTGSNQNTMKPLDNCDYVATWYDPTKVGTFTIIEGDTYDLNVDCLIVLATNSLFPVQITPNETMLKESRDQMQIANRSYDVGHVFIPYNGDTKNKDHAYIVVGLSNSLHKKNERFHGLSSTFKEIFNRADDSQWKTICLPAFITEGFLSTEMIVDAYLDAVIECQKVGKPLKFYLFCERSKKVLTDPLMKQVHKKYKKELGFSRNLYKHSVLDVKGFETKSKPYIVVQELLIEDVKAEVIVNTTSRNLDLEKGIVSKRLLKLAGDGMLAECKKHYPNGIGYTTIASTSPGRLSYKNRQVRCVFHGALPVFKRETYIQNVKTFVRCCLAEADKKKYQSIAFPALGTGSRGYPGREAAKAMFDAVEDYRSEAVNRHIEKVVFSLYSKDKDICMVFKREEKKRTPLKAVKKAKYNLRPYNEIKSNARKLNCTITGSHHPVEIQVGVGSDINPLSSNVVEIKMHQETESSVRWKYSDEMPETNNDQLLVPIKSGDSKESIFSLSTSSPSTNYTNSLKIAVRYAVTKCLDNNIAEIAFDIDSGPSYVSADAKVTTIATEIKNCLSIRKQGEGIVLHTVYVRLVDENQFESVTGTIKTSWLSSTMASIGMESHLEWQIIESQTKVEIVGETTEIVQKVKKEMLFASYCGTDPLSNISGDGSDVDGGFKGARPKTTIRMSPPKDLFTNQAVADQEEHLKTIQEKGKREEQSNCSDTHDNASGRNEEERMDEEQEEEDVRETTKLVLEDLPIDAHSEFIKLFFERRKFGGFDVLNVEMDEEHFMALVELSDPEAVVKVLQQRPIEMLKTEIRVKPYFEVEELEEPLCTIVVCGLFELDEETIEMYFENKKRAGGDEIENLNMIEEGKAFITYKSEEVARRVVDKGNHVLNRKLLEVTLWQPPPKQTWNIRTPEPEPELGPADTIKVRGIGDSLDKQTIEIKDMTVEEDVASITNFSEEDDPDGFGKGNTSMVMAMSDEYTLDDGNDSDGTLTDSSTDSETTTGRGIDVIVHYKSKLRKKLKEFKKPLYIPLTLEKYLKWQYITNSCSLLQQRMAKLANISENVTINDGILEIFLKIQKEAYDSDSLAKTLEETLLSGTDSIAVSWFPLRASHPSTEFLQVLNSVIQHSDIADELYTDMTDTLNSKVIRIIHDVKYTDRAKEITNKAEQEFEKKILSDWHSLTINLPIVYSQIFEKLDMKRRVRTVSDAVLVFFNVMESKDEFNVELRGQRKDVYRVRKWIEEEFVNPYCCLELGYDEVQLCKESIDIPRVIMNTLERKNYQDVFWTINNHSRKTWICSSNSDNAHKAVQVVKTCVKQIKEFKITTKPVEEIESIVEELVAVNRDRLGRSVSVRVLTEYNKDLVIYLTGEEHQLDCINNWFDSYMRSTTSMNSYADMDEVINLFTREQGQSTIQEVHLLHPNDECTNKAMKTCTQMSVKADIKVHGRDLVFSTANNLRPYSAGNSLMGTNMSFTIGPKKVMVNVAMGDMKSVSVDGIVCIQDVDFSNSSQTAKDILRLCGQRYKDEFNEVRIYSQVIGTVFPIRIRNGGITCQYVINVILPNCTSVDFDKSAPTLKEVTSNILRESEQLKLTSLAMPYLESIEDSKLDWHVSNTSSCEAMVSSILAFFNNDDTKEKTFLRRLDIRVNEEEILRELNLTFKRLCDQ